MTRSIGIFLLFMLLAPFARAQQPSFIYEGNTTDPSRIVGHIWNGVLIEGEFTDMSYAIMTTDGVRIYDGSSTSPFDVLYTLREDMKVYRGDSRFLSDVMCTIRGPHIYYGDSENSLDLAFTYKGSHIYDGQGTAIFDAVVTVLPSVSMLEAVMILVAAEYLF